MKLGIYGGTFNPIHYGHLRTAQEVLDMLALDKIMFVPSGRPPFHKPDLESSAHRYEMVRRAIAGNRAFGLSDIEIKRRGISYSVDTVKRLRRGFKDRELFFILGIDAFLDLPRWRDPDTLLSSITIVVISRPDHTFSGLSTSPYLRSVPAKTLRDMDRGKAALASFSISNKQKGYLCAVTALNISASRIRAMVTAGQKIKYLLPDSVNSYIISHNLYRKREVGSGT